ncbi:MAG: LLM class flavin-dependent oxidoreductase [bacterium]|nr:LLM class flavin-dependent oxidoreductase [bacterium]
MATQGILRPGTGKRNAIHQTRNLADRPGSARRGKADPPSGASAGVSGQMDRHPLRRPRTGMTFGVLLPHFGPHASRTRLIEGIKLIEDLGFDAVWARDHLLWHPHSHEEHTDMTFLEPFTTLIGLGTLVERLVIGTGVMIPVRHPIRVAQQYMTLSYLTGGRVIAGFGAGHGGELRAAGIDPDRKHQAVLEMIEIVRRLWAGNGVTFEGEIFRIHHASLEPKLQHPLPILYGGPSRRAARIAACHADGWLAGTVPLTTVDARLSYMRELLGSIDHLFLSVTPRTILDEDRERARTSVDVERMSRDGKRNWVTPPGGAFRTLEDIRGVVVVGDAHDVAAGVIEYYKRGFDHFTFDVRNQFDRFEETLEAISGSVLPIVRKEIARSNLPQSNRRS